MTKGDLIVHTSAVMLLPHELLLTSPTPAAAVRGWGLGVGGWGGVCTVAGPRETAHVVVVEGEEEVRDGTRGQGRGVEYGGYKGEAAGGPVFALAAVEDDDSGGGGGGEEEEECEGDEGEKGEGAHGIGKEGGGEAMAEVELEGNLTRLREGGAARGWNGILRCATCGKIHPKPRKLYLTILPPNRGRCAPVPAGHQPLDCHQIFSVR